MTLEEITSNKFKKIHQVVSSLSFRNMDALNGEIPFWIAPYDIAANNQVESEIKNLETKLLNSGIRPLNIDLFELSCNILEENIGLDEIFEIEKEMDKYQYKDALQSSINIHERFIPLIIQLVEEQKPHMLFIKSVGAVYPFIRSHTVLNNLQSAVKNIPTLMFFPGEYSGQSLNLFGLLKDDNYYRAFNIDNHNI